MRTKLITVGLLATAAVMLPACATNTDGKAVNIPTVTTDTAPVVNAELPAQAPSAAPFNAELHKMLEVAAQENKRMWEQVLPAKLPEITVVTTADPLAKTCATDIDHSMAWTCPEDGIIIYDAAQVQEMVDTAETGRSTAVVVIAHEVGHIGQVANGYGDDPDEVYTENNADCDAGAFFRWVYDGNTERFRTDPTRAAKAVEEAFPTDDPIISPDQAKMAQDEFKRGFNTARLCVGDKG